MRLTQIECLLPSVSSLSPVFLSSVLYPRSSVSIRTGSRRCIITDLVKNS